MERRPLLVLGAGAAVGAALTQPLDTNVHVLLLAAVALFLGWPAMRRAEPGRFLLYAALALVGGAVSGTWHNSHLSTPAIHTHTTRVPCTVLDVGSSDEQGSAYTCVTDEGPTLEVVGSGTAPLVGEHVLVRGRLDAFDGPRNPGEPDEASIQRERGIAARLSSAHVLARLRAPPMTIPIVLARMHAWALAQLRARLSEPYASIVAGELWGERSMLAPELRTEFQETGTVHILVTAGLHLGVVALVVMTLLRKITVPRAACCALTIAAIWSYAIFSGLHLPALRAAAMISAGVLAYGCGAFARSWSAYGAALGAFAIFSPESIGTASFALSFSCVGAILLLSDEIAATLERAALPERVKEALVLTTATQIGTWPLTASIFLLFSPYALLANLLVVPVVGITMILAAAQLMFATVSPIAQLFANANSWLLAWIVAAVHTIASLPKAAIPMTPPPVWAIAAYDASLVGGLWLWKHNARTPAMAGILLALSLILAPPLRADTRLRITVLDVGQADGIVIQTPRGHVLLVDAGGRLERGTGAASSAERVGERIVVPFLRRAGVHRIDALILSHPHGDHVGGFAPVLRAFHVDEFADSGQRYGGYAYNDALQTAHSEHVPIVYPRAGAVWKTEDGLTLVFVGPSLPFIAGSQNDINNNSIAFILQYKKFRMLFTGDAGAEAERRLLDEGIDLHADVLKVGHHGSAYSSTPAFIAAVHPRYAVISVGRHNLFGHPAPSTIETLQRCDARIYRTDETGAASVDTDGSEITVRTIL